jgi:hypothetical protein
MLLKTGYVLQLTPSAKLQPDVQVVRNPTCNPDAHPAVIVQIQLLEFVLEESPSFEFPDSLRPQATLNRVSGRFRTY